MDAGRFIEDPHFEAATYVPPEKKPFPWMLVIVGLVVLIAGTLLALRIFVYDFARVPGSGMAPTLAKGAMYLVDRRTVGSDLNRNTIVVFRNPQSRGQKVIQRVMGLPGERIEIKNGKLYVNYMVWDLPGPQIEPEDDYGPITVPAGSYFMLGDNINQVRDSREFGCVPHDHVIGSLAMKLREGTIDVEREIGSSRTFQ